MERGSHSKKFEIIIAITGMLGGAMLPFPPLLGWGFFVFLIANFLSMIFFYGRKMYWLACLAFYFVIVDAIGVWINLLKGWLV
jgi:hypothetical protein